MTPKARLTLAIVALTGAIALALAAVSLHAIVETRFSETAGLARIAAAAVQGYLLQRIPEAAAPSPEAGIEEVKAAWYEAARRDPRITAFLLSTLAATPALVEILVADDRGEVLTGTDPSRAEAPAPVLDDLEAWTRQPLRRKLREVLAPARDLSLRQPIGVAGSPQPVFTIHVTVSTALVREAILPQLRRLALLFLAGLIGAGLAAGILASLAARPLARVSQIIDLISQGGSAAALPPAPPDRETAAIESKLSLLGEQVRGAARVDHMLERLQDAVLLFDAGNKLLIASQAADRFLSAPRWELIGRPIEEVFPNTTPLGALLESSVLRLRPLRNHRLEWSGAAGRTMLLAVDLDILTDFPDRRPLGAVVTLRDAASRRELESQIESSRRREAFGRLLQGVAHEIKNPLNSISTHIQLLQLQFGDRVPEARAEMEVIGREIKTLDRMVVTLLDFTKPLELHPVEVDLAGLAGEIAALVRPQAEAAGVHVTVEAPPAPVLVQADRSLVRQAVLNVVKNGVECMTTPGEVRLTVSETPDEAALAVSDQGPGIPEGARDKIFRLYFTTKGRRGSGIGLAMAYRIMQFHDGALDFDTEPGKGTTFHFRFVRRPAAASNGSSPTTAS